MYNIATSQSASEMTRLPPVTVVSVPAAPMTAGDVVARVTQSAQTSVEQCLHKLQVRAMSTHCQVNCHGVSAATARDFQREVVAWVAQFEARY